ASVVAANVEEPIGGKFGWMRRARISCSAACKVAIVGTTGTGTCTSVTPDFLAAQFGSGATAVGGKNCTVNPTVKNTVATINIAGGAYQEVSLEGYYAAGGNGFAVENLTSLTGELDVTLE